MRFAISGVCSLPDPGTESRFQPEMYGTRRISAAKIAVWFSAPLSSACMQRYCELCGSPTMPASPNDSRAGQAL